MNTPTLEIIGDIKEPPLTSEGKRVITTYTTHEWQRPFRFDFVLPPTVYNDIMPVNEVLKNE